MRTLSLLSIVLPIVALASLFRLERSQAGTAIRLDIGGLVDRADLVLEGCVTAEHAVIGPASRIDTEFTIAVEHTYLGDPLATRVIRWPGGVLPDGRGMALPGMPRLSVGSRAILFLTAADSVGMRMPVGLAQGELSIAIDAIGGKHVVRDQSDLSLVDPRTGSVAHADAKCVLDYAGTIAEIEARVAAKRARPATGSSPDPSSSGARPDPAGKERR
jgi:hypothetical protein